MTLTPRQVHQLDQLGALVQETGELLAAYKRLLMRAGLSEGEAWELVRRLEVRLMGPVMDRTAEDLRDERNS